MSSGLWDQAPPICYNKQLLLIILHHCHCIIIYVEPCDNPPTIKNGMVVMSDQTPGSIATYVCNDHYQLNGNATIVCQSDSYWLGKVPKCKSKYIGSYVASYIMYVA